MNQIAPENCNKAHCKSRMFREDGDGVKLSPERMVEIITYLSEGTSHICHVTDKTCYGGLLYQSKIFYALKLIPEPTVDSLLNTARKHLGIKPIK